MKTAQLQQAKASLSEYVQGLDSQGPVMITVRGREAAVLMSKKDYDRRQRSAGGLLEFFRRSPGREIPLDLERDKSPQRKIRL